MDSVVEYLDAAKSRLGVRADAKIAFELNVSAGYINHLRFGRAWPGDEFMVRLAELAGADPQRAILQLHLWRASSDRVSRVYSSIIQRLGAACVAGTLVIAGSYSVEAKTNTENRDIYTAETVYIIKNKDTVLKQDIER